MTLLEANHPVPILDIVLEGFAPEAEPETFPGWWQSQPIVGADYFLGIEFTVASGRKYFEEYIGLLRPSPKGIHFNYNSWWSMPMIGIVSNI